MIESIKFENFKVLQNATLPLGPCTILVGPNGSGKSTVLQALEVLSGSQNPKCAAVLPAAGASLKRLKGCFDCGPPDDGVRYKLQWPHDQTRIVRDRDDKSGRHFDSNKIARIAVYSFDANAIAKPVRMQDNLVLARDGTGLPGVLSHLQDQDRDRFQSLEVEFCRWLPEFDQIQFGLTGGRQELRTLSLRTRDGHHKIPAADLSQGTLIALAILTLVYQLEEPPLLIALEEPDRGLHPHLLRHVQDALHRLAYPESCEEKREPVQVIATTHSPYFLDLFKDYPEEIVIADKQDGNVQFRRLCDLPNVKDILGEEPLGEAWFLGVLGGVPSTP